MLDADTIPYLSSVTNTCEEQTRPALTIKTIKIYLVQIPETPSPRCTLLLQQSTFPQQFRDNVALVSLENARRYKRRDTIQNNVYLTGVTMIEQQIIEQDQYSFNRHELTTQINSFNN